MYTITIDEAINGYTVSIHNWEKCKAHREICERDIDAWEIVRNYATKQVEKGLDRIQKSSLDVGV